MIRLEQRMDTRFDRLDDKVARLFAWVVGIQVTVLLAVIGSLLSIVAILAPDSRRSAPAQATASWRLRIIPPSTPGVRAPTAIRMPIS